MSKITLIGMERYLNPDHSIFENMQLPEGIDKDTLIGSIILRCQEFELLFSDPDFMIAAVNVWSRKNYWTFDKWVKLINEDYDPLYIRIIMKFILIHMRVNIQKKVMLLIQVIMKELLI